MKTPKDEDSTGPAAKKMKQARLPFMLLTAKVAKTKTDEENTVKDETQNEKADKTAKENAKIDEIIVLEDSVELTDQFKGKSETEKVPNKSVTRKRSISVSPPKKVVSRKRQKTSKNEETPTENDSESTSIVVSPEKAKKTQNLKNESDNEEVELSSNSSAVQIVKDVEMSEELTISVTEEDDKDLESKVTKNLRKKSSPKKKVDKDNNEEEVGDNCDSKATTDQSSSRRESLRKVNKKVLPKKKEVVKEVEKSKKQEEEEEEEEIDDCDSKTTTKRQSLEEQKEVIKDSVETKQVASKSDSAEMKEVIKVSGKTEQVSSKLDSTEQCKNLENDTPEKQDGGLESTATPPGVDKTPKSRKRTPSQLEKQKESAKKQAEKEQKLMEKERLKKEREDELNRLKEEKLKMKHDKEEQKKREKEEKEELKKKEKEEKEELKKKEKEEREKKRLAEIELKNEAKRLKEEEKKKANEAKEEEKRKRDEAKEEEKRKKEADKRKAAEAFASFFKAKESGASASAIAADEADVENMEVDSTVEKFMPFEVKGDMRLSSVCRRTLDVATKSALDKTMQSQDAVVSDLYLHLLKSKKHLPLTGERTWPYVDETDDEIMIIEAEVNEDGCKDTSKEVHKEKKTKRYKAKLLQFEENRRPPYWGTWRKKSASIGARRPFSVDKTMFEYDVDSDDEWEEEEPGESLRGSDEENEKESEDEYEVDNKVFVPHGYLSDEELQEEFEDCSREAQKAKLQLLEIEFQAEMSQKTEKLKPRLIGCVWLANSLSDPSTVGSRIGELLLSRRMVMFGADVVLPVEVNNRLQSTTESSSSSSPLSSSPLIEHTGRKSKFPESAVPMLIKLVHGNQNKLGFLVREFSSYLTKNCVSTLDVPSITTIRREMRHMAKWVPFLAQDSSTCPLAGKMCWYVSKDVREKYEVLLNDTELVTDPWQYILPVPRRSSLPLPATVIGSDHHHHNHNHQQQLTVDHSPKMVVATSITKFTKKMTEEERKKQLLQMATDRSPSTNSTSSLSSPAASKQKTTPCNSSEPIRNKKTPGKPSNLLAKFVSLKNNNSGTPTKSKQSNDEDDNDDDVKLISPDKTDQVLKESAEKDVKSTTNNNTDSSSLPIKSSGGEESGPKTPVVKKRVQLITLTTFSKTPKSVEKTSKGIEDEKSAASKSAATKPDSVEGKTSRGKEDETSAASKGSETKLDSVEGKQDTPASKSTQEHKSPVISADEGKQDENTSASKSTQEQKSSDVSESLGTNLLDDSKSPSGFLGFPVTGIEKTPSSQGVSTVRKASDDSSETGSQTKTSRTSLTSFFARAAKKATTNSAKKQSEPVDGKQSTDCADGSGEAEDVSMQEMKVRSASSSPCQTPAKKRVKLITLSPPKWRVKLSKPQLPVNDDDDDGDSIAGIESL